jgi:PAS domain S-box-containing protein
MKPSHATASLPAPPSAHHAELLQALADTSTDAIFAKDYQGRYLLFNRAAAQIAGVRVEDVIGRDDAALFPQQAPEIRARDVALMERGEPVTFEEELHTPIGLRIFLTTKGPLRDARSGRVNGLFGVARDVTDSVLARQRIERSEQRYRLAAAGGYVWDWDLQHGRGETHSSFWVQLGREVPADDQVFEHFSALVHPQDRERWRAALRAHIVERVPYELEFRARHADGRWRWFHTQGQAMWDETGRATYMAGTTFDITARREAEEVLQRTRGELSQLLLRLMEQERDTTQRLAQTLHDRLGQALGGARLHLDVALAHGDPQQHLQRVSMLLDDAIADVRHLLVELRPPLLQEFGLAAALDNEVRTCGADGLRIALALDCGAAASQARWPDAVEYAAFMIAREALANALRHAQAASVRLHLDGDGHRLELVAQDDGIGIADDAHQGRPGHLGLVGMRERAASIGATLSVVRGEHGGTRVHLAWQAQPHTSGTP